MTEPTQMYTYICERCGEIRQAKFFKSHKIGYRWGEKCENCSLNLQNGVKLKKAFEKTRKEYKEIDPKVKIEVIEILANIGGRTLK